MKKRLLIKLMKMLSEEDRLYTKDECDQYIKISFDSIEIIGFSHNHIICRNLKEKDEFKSTIIFKSQNDLIEYLTVNGFIKIQKGEKK